MQKSYWQARWRKNKIGFHSPEPNEALTMHWHELGLSEGSRVAVPLSGKAVDMVWLRERGHEVTGIEFVEQACHEFYEEILKTRPEIEKEKRAIRFESGGITLLCADFFKLKPGDVGRTDAFYDRAALVALPEDIRPQYVRKKLELFPQARKGLLVTFEYDTSLMQGPPFCVPAEEVNRLYSPAFNLKLLSETDLLPVSEKYRRMGLNEMIQKVWLMEGRAMNITNKE